MRANEKKILGASVLAAVASVAGCGGNGNPNVTGGLSVAPVVSGTGKEVVLGSLIEGRAGAAVALVGTGSVLVAGGRTSGGSATDTAELVDGETGVSAPLLARMTTARSGARAVRLPDGRILILGGADASSHALPTSEIFDPSNGTFLRGPALARPHVNAPVAVSGTTLTLAGGENETSVETIDLATLAPGKTFATLARSHAGGRAVASGNQVIVGGDDQGTEVIDATGAVHSLSSPEGLVRFATLVPVSDGALLVGGTDGFSLRSRTTEIRGSLTAAMVTRPRGSIRVGGVAVPFAGGELVLGGRLDLDAPLQPATDLLLPSGDTGLGPTLATPRTGGEAVALSDGRVLLVGGQDLQGQLVPAIEMLIPPGGRTPEASVAFAEEAQVFADRDAETAARNKADAQDALLTRELAQANAARLADEARITSLTTLYDDTLTQLQDEQAQLQQSQAELATAKAAEATLTAELQAANQTIASDNTQIATLQQREAAAQASITAANAQIAQLNGQVSSLGNQVTALQGQVSALDVQLAQAKATPAPAPVAAPAPVLSKAAALAPQPFTPSNLVTRPFIQRIDPQGSSVGDTVRIWMGQDGTSDQVFFSRIPAQVLDHSTSGIVNGSTAHYLDVIIPVGAPTNSAVQVIGDGLTSGPFGYTVQ
jgi:hypothetical protein